MENLTIHVFGYGETQIIKKDVNFKTATSDLTKVQPLLDALWAMKPEDVTGGDGFRSVTFFNFSTKQWMGKKDEASFTIKGEDTLVAQIDELIAEMEALVPEK
jgi:hypothetical protein